MSKLMNQAKQSEEAKAVSSWTVKRPPLLLVYHRQPLTRFTFAGSVRSGSRSTEEEAGAKTSAVGGLSVDCRVNQRELSRELQLRDEVRHCVCCRRTMRQRVRNDRGSLQRKQTRQGCDDRR